MSVFVRYIKVPGECNITTSVGGDDQNVMVKKLVSNSHCPLMEAVS